MISRRMRRRSPNNSCMIRCATSGGSMPASIIGRHGRAFYSNSSSSAVRNYVLGRVPCYGHTTMNGTRMKTYAYDYYCSLDGEPCLVGDTEAWLYHDGNWKQISLAAVAMDAVI